MKIDSIDISSHSKPFIIAEMSGNHNKSIIKAFEIIKNAYESNATAIKIQTINPNQITLNCLKENFIINDPKSLWNGKRLYDLYSEVSLPLEWHEEIFNYAKSLGLIAFSSPFDTTAVEFLEKLSVPCYKIASFEITDTNLLSVVGSTGKPIILSTGMAKLAEIEEAINILERVGCNQYALLKCTSTYPASPIDSNILTIKNLKDIFKCEVGLSDHTMGIGVSVAAVALGATIIEKHITNSRNEGGIDSQFSMEPEEFKKLVQECNNAFDSLGNITYGPTKSELQSMQFRRSIYACKKINQGEKFSYENLKIVRPGFGLPPSYYEKVIGKKATRDHDFGDPILWDSF